MYGPGNATSDFHTKRCGTQNMITALSRGKNKGSKTYERTHDRSKPRERTKRKKRFKETFPRIKPKAATPTSWPGGSRQAQKETQAYKKRAFFSLKSLKVQEQSSRLKKYRATVLSPRQQLRGPQRRLLQVWKEEDEKSPHFPSRSTTTSGAERHGEERMGVGLSP